MNVPPLDLRDEDYPYTIEFLVHRTGFVLDRIEVTGPSALHILPYAKMCGEPVAVRFRFPGDRTLYQAPGDKP